MDKNILGYVLLVAITLGLVFVGGKILVQKIKNEVMNEFKRPYAPGPYQPGFDPDKVPTSPSRAIYDDLGAPQDWNSTWELQRF